MISLPAFNQSRRFFQFSIQYLSILSTALFIILNPGFIYADVNDHNEKKVHNQLLSPVRHIETCIVKGNQLKFLLEEPYGNYSLLALNENNTLKPVPFQFDDQNVNGLIYVPGGKILIDGKEGILDPQDELAFMLEDSGQKASDLELANAEGQLIAEISIDVNESRQQYVYLFKDNPDRSNKFYTHFDQTTGLLTTKKFSQQFDPKSILIWENYYYSDFIEKNKTLLDSAKIRVKVKLGLLKVTLNNTQLPNKIVGVKNGPVRSVIEMDASLAVFGRDIIAAGGNLTATKNSLHFAVEATTPKAVGFIKDNLLIEYSYDFNKLDGMKFTSALASDKIIIAGVEKEKPDLNSINLEHNWFSGSTGKGWDFVGFFQRNVNFDGEIQLLYKDKSMGDEYDEPERFPGSSPQIGYYISGVPAGTKFRFGIDFYYAPNFWQDNQLMTSIKQLQNPALIKVNPVKSDSKQL